MTHVARKVDFLGSGGARVAHRRSDGHSRTQLSAEWAGTEALLDGHRAGKYLKPPFCQGRGGLAPHAKTRRHATLEDAQALEHDAITPDGLDGFPELDGVALALDEQV